ncbi:sulfurtransferase [Actinotalea sp.]|uniref:sulfurtransferase n=1 Tax=Actinotalea sp. TaxID=1872145 RepID=UPI00356168BC
MEIRALVQPDDLLAELVAEPDVLVVDVRWTLAGADRDGYLAGHVPGAVFCDLDAELAGPPGEGGRHPLPTVEQLAALMARLGIAPDRRVVVLDGGAGAAAARAWWCLRWVGHQDVRVLDGGMAGWLAAGGPVEEGEVIPVPSGDVVVHAGSMPTVTADDVLHRTVGRLLDARAPERFRGETEPVDPVAGHIPGAVSCWTGSLQGPDGRYLPREQLREVLLGADEVVDLTAYCGSGVTASQLVLAGHEVGLEVALYPGSWSEWVRDESRPVATGV